VPADSAMGFETEALRVAVAESRRERVSDIVEGGEAERREMRDSIAATGWVTRGSVARRRL